jgi:membrane protein implicated in regulation of membrane protease activity
MFHLSPHTDSDIFHITVAKGWLGIAAPMLGVVTSLMQDVEWALRVVALIAGVVVSVLSAASILKNLYEKKK